MTKTISIHAAREGGDVLPISAINIASSFQSTPPVKAATCKLAVNVAGRRISIHAAREGGDAVFDIRRSVNLHFNPRRP